MVPPLRSQWGPGRGRAARHALRGGHAEGVPVDAGGDAGGTVSGWLDGRNRRYLGPGHLGKVFLPGAYAKAFILG
jgi:hypothetical protein